MIEKTLSLEQALNKAQTLCARQEKCSWDIRTKLKQWHVATEESEKIIDKLKADKFIDDVRYAQLFARDKSKFNKWGPIKIAYSLKSKKIPDEIIKSVVDEIKSVSNDKILFELLSKKSKTIKAKSSYDLKVKLIRFGISRGFDYNQINETVILVVKAE
jgi:regulatory protein